MILIFYQKLQIMCMQYWKTIRVLNSLDPDQYWYSISHDLSGSKLFAKVISGQQESPLARKELIFIIYQAYYNVYGIILMDVKNENC